MAYTQSDLAKIDAAIASGVLEVEFDGQRHRYRSVNELLKARKFVADDIAQSDSTTRRPRNFRINVDKGI